MSLRQPLGLRLPSAGGLPQNVPTLPVSKIDELSFALDDLTSAPADVQRADIISLMELRAPGTLGASSQEAMLERQDQTGLASRPTLEANGSPGSGTIPVTPGYPGAVPPGAYPGGVPPNAAYPGVVGQTGAYPPNYGPYGPYGSGSPFAGEDGNSFQRPVPQPAQNFVRIHRFRQGGMLPTARSRHLANWYASSMSIRWFSSIS